MGTQMVHIYVVKMSHNMQDDCFKWASPKGFSGSLPRPPFQRMDNRFSDCPNVQLPIVQLPHGEYPAAWDGLRIDSTTLIGHLAHISIKINGHVVEVLDATVRKVD